MRYLSLALLVPAALAQIGALILRPVLWEMHLQTTLRGPAHESNEASGIMILLVMVPAIVGLTYVPAFKNLLGSGGSGDGEIEAGLGILLLRAGALAVFYLGAWRALTWHP